MLVVVSDTHAREGTRLTGRTREAVRAADRVVHVGDFVTGRVLDAFERACAGAGAAFDPVYGNGDAPAVRERVPATRTVEYAGVRLAIAHGHEHTDTTLPLFGRQAGADCVVVGHTHRPAFGALGGVPVLEPGSHAEPRGTRAAHAELVPVGGERTGTESGARNGRTGDEVENDGAALDGRLVTPAGETIERFRVRRRRGETGSGKEGLDGDGREKGRRERD